MPHRKSAYWMASQIETSLVFVHRANIERYKRLLATNLSDEDRLLIRGQLAKEELALLRLDGK